jgi:hypothetical protein
MTRLCGLCGNRITAKDIAARRFVFSNKSRTYFCIRCALTPAPVPIAKPAPIRSGPSPMRPYPGDDNLRPVPARGLSQR